MIKEGSTSGIVHPSESPPAAGSAAESLATASQSWPPLQWLDIFATGVAEIDDDHRHLLEDSNEILRLLSGGHPWPEVVAAANRMREHCITHFRREEDVLAREKFSDLPNHAAEHRRIEMELAEILGVIVDTIEPTALHRELVLSLRSMLIDHLLRFDLGYKSHLLFRRGR